MGEAGRTSVSDEDINRVAQEMAEAVGIEADAARRVLELLHVDKLNENLAAMDRILSDREATNALGMSHEAAAQLRQTLAAEGFRLENLRLGIKPAGQQGLVV
jgi:hypothetical protein